MKRVSAGEMAVAALVLVFAVAGIVWFVISIGDGGDFQAGDAFAGLGYLAATLAVALAAIWFLRNWIGPTPPEPVTRAPVAPPAEAAGDRLIVLHQMRFGAALIALGAVLGVVFGVVLNDQNGVAIAMGTAAIGAGAALIPAGAATSASHRILQTLHTPAGAAPPAQDDAEAEPAEDAAATGVVDEAEAYGDRSPVTGLSDEDVQGALESPPLTGQELGTTAGGTADTGAIAAGQPEAGVVAVADAGDDDDVDDADAAEAPEASAVATAEADEAGETPPDGQGV
jgi:hypothetical protein